MRSLSAESSINWLLIPEPSVFKCPATPFRLIYSYKRSVLVFVCNIGVSEKSGVFVKDPTDLMTNVYGDTLVTTNGTMHQHSQPVDTSCSNSNI